MDDICYEQKQHMCVWNCAVYVYSCITFDSFHKIFINTVDNINQIIIIETICVHKIENE